MDNEKAKIILKNILKNISYSTSSEVLERFSSLRDVDAKVKEVKMVLDSLQGRANQVLNEMEKDEDFKANSRRVRLEALTNYCKIAINFLDTGLIEQEKPVIRPPDFSRLTSTVPALEEIIHERWIEAQKCKNIGAYLSAVVMMGSVLEGLLLAKAFMTPADSNRATHAPKNKAGKNVAIQDWNLNALLNVAVELGWIKVDRGKFGHALRESRNIVHPWAHMSAKTNFDLATCNTCWQVLNASVDDLLKSVS